MRVIRRLDEFRALVLGAAVFATGGGGDPDYGLRLLKEVYVDRGRELVLLDIDEVSGWIASTYSLGSLVASQRRARPRAIENTVERALELAKKVLGVEIEAFIPVELGGGNTAIALYAAALGGRAAVDGDRVGRAAPEVHQDTFVLFDIGLAPAIAVTATGFELAILSYPDIDSYEELLRGIAAVHGGVRVLDGIVEASRAREAIIRGSVSRCIEVGRMVMENIGDGKRVARAIAEAVGGWVVFEGVVSSWSWRDEGGFMYGELVVEGRNSFEGRKLVSWIKNEHIMVWLDGRPLVMPPDLFMLLDTSGMPIINSRIEVGMKVIGIAAPAPSVWRSEKGLELFGPKRFGFDYQYTPVEKLVAEHGLT